MSITCLSLALVGSMSCSKQDFSNSSTSDVTLGVTKDVGQKKYTLKREGENGPFCPRPAGNCTKITLISVGDDYGISAIFDIIRNGDSDEIITAFSENQGELSSVLLLADIENVINGTLHATVDTNTEGVDFLVLENESEVETAYRFKFV